MPSHKFTMNNKPLTQLNRLQMAAGVAAINLLNLGGEVPDGDTLSIGWRTYECDDQADPRITTGNVRVPVFAWRASATLNFDQGTNLQDGNTVTVGTKVYTFKTTLTNVDGYIQIGPTIHRSIYNLVAAMNVGRTDLYEPPANYGALNDVGEGARVAYAAATTENAAEIEAGYGNDYDLWLTHWPGGAVGGTVALAETVVGTGAWDEGGFMDGPSHPSAAQFGTALVSALNSDRHGPVWAEVLSATEVLVWARHAGNRPMACAETFTSGSNTWEWSTLVGGQSGEDGLRPAAAVHRVATAQEASRGAMHFVFGFEPAGTVLQVRDATGALITFDGTVALSGRRVTVTEDTVAIATGQVFNLIVWL